MRCYWEQYLACDLDAKNPNAAPLEARDLSDLPSATVVTCGWDPLRDESVDYAEHLSEQRNAVTLIDVFDSLQGFLSYWDRIDRAVDATTHETDVRHRPTRYVCSAARYLFESVGSVRRSDSEGVSRSMVGARTRSSSRS